MSQVILKKSSVAGKVPLVTDLAYGELAINYADGIAYFKKSDNTIGTIGGTQSAQTLLDLIKTIDGSGSGLDADLLDGQSGAYYLDWTNTTNKPTTLAGYGIVDAATSTHNHSGTYQPLDADLTAIAALAGTSGFLKKTAADTWSLDISTYLTGNQSISVSGDATGSGATSIALTLANSGVTAGTYTKVTVDAKGRVTTGASLASADLPTYTGTITSSQVTTALGFTPYNSTNPNGYTTNTGTVTSVGGTGTVSGLTLTGTVTTTGNLTLGGTLAVTPANFASQTANTVLAAPNGVAGVPTFRALVAADIPTLNQSTTGSAAKWTTARTLSFTGDATGSGSVDGSTNVATALTLANSGVTAGTYTKITVDAKGRATSGTTLSASDIPNLDAAKITSGVLDAARLPSYVDDVLEYANLASFPTTGETGKIYVDLTTNKTYRWSGTVYVYITSGAVDSVAGKTGVVTLVKGDVGLGSVDNTADANKNVLSATKLTTARTISLTGDVTGSVSFDGSGNAAIATTISADSVALGTDTTGNYVASVVTTAPLSGGAVGSEGGALTLSLASGYGDTQNPYASKTANYFLAAPNGAAGTPTFRAIVAADIPTLNQNTTGSSGSCTGNAATATTATNLSGGTIAATTGSFSGDITASGSVNIGGTIGTRATSLSIISSAGNSPAVFKASGANPVFSITPTSDGGITLSCNKYFNNNQFVQASNTTDSCLIVLSAGGATWYSSNNGGTSWNQAQGVELWNQAGIIGSAAKLSTTRTITIGSTGKAFNGSADVAWSLAEIGAYAATNPNGYTTNTGTVTSVGGTGTVSGLTLTGTITTSGNLTLGGTLSVSIDNITDEHRVFNNMGSNHATRTAFDAQGVAATVNFGNNFVQGNTNSPGTNSAAQYYTQFLGLGNDYAYNTYGMQIAYPRNVTTPYISIRYEEGGVFGAWQKISAGYADSAGAVAWSGITSKPTTLSGYGITDAASSSHVGSTGTAHGQATTSVAGFMSSTDKGILDGLNIKFNVLNQPNLVMATGTSGLGFPNFRALVSADIPATLSDKTLINYVETVYNLTGTDISPANGPIQYCTLAAARTFTESLADGQSVTLMINPATFAATWPTTTWIGSTASTAPTLVASVYNCITFFQFGGTLYGKYEGRV